MRYLGDQRKEWEGHEDEDEVKCLKGNKIMWRIHNVYMHSFIAYLFDEFINNRKCFS
jgi:hypothetical protein